MAKKIALFNHKGGVSKTTTTFNLGWMLAEMGKRVILVDSDPQCNLTGLILGYKDSIELEQFYREYPTNNIRDALAPAFEAKPKPIEPVDCVPVAGREGLYLLPGHINFAEYEVTLGIAQELSGSIYTLKNLPGSIADLLDKTAESLGVDYILIDMSPSVSSVNQNLLMTSDYFLVPSSPDYYSVMAFNSLTTILGRWSAWSKRAQSLPVLKDADYPFPEVTPKFLGTVIQRYKVRKGKASRGFQEWINEINRTVSSKLVPQLQNLQMMLSEEGYRNHGVGDHYCLEEIPDFNTLIATSQDEQVPVFALTEEQVAQVGKVLDNSMAKVSDFHDTFKSLATKVIGLTEDADSH